jgi:hypothetical protein
MSYAAVKGVHSVALVGDSFTFGLEVPFRDCWGYRLQQLLGSSAQVLNFGVDGFGVDQAYLRYARDARAWHPRLVVLGFINHDLKRSMVVYSFVSFPEWDFPFAKPRFVVKDGSLELRNVPVPGPETFLAAGSLDELPLIEYDPGYWPFEWRRRPYHDSYLIRLVVTRFPRWRKPRPELSGQTAVVNIEILTAFVRLARAEGSTPLIVYLPSRTDFSDDTRETRDSVVRTLRERGIEVEDLTPCLEPVGVAQLFIQERPHYSPAGNSAVAACIEPVVRRCLAPARGSPDAPRRSPRNQ